MADRKSQQKYYPPNYDPSKGSLNTQQGQHHLRDRARKLSQGILIVRIELPFHVWCGKCEAHLAKGVRFNAEKRQCGTYLSTKLFEFRFKCQACSSPIVMCTDPKAGDFTITEGGRRRVDTWVPDEGDLQFMVPPPMSAEEKQRIESDAFAKLEKRVDDQRVAAAAKPRLELLEAVRQSDWESDFARNRQLRARLRAVKNDAKARLEAGRAKGVEVPLLDAAPSDRELSHTVRDGMRAARVSADDNAAIARQQLAGTDAVSRASAVADTRTLRVAVKRSLAPSAASSVPVKLRGASLASLGGDVPLPVRTAARS